MPTLAVDIPTQTLTHLAMDPEAFADTMKLMTALKMYELGQLSSQEAAALVAVSRQAFLQLLRTYQVPPYERVDTTGAPTCPVQEMVDAEVLRYATMQMPAWQQRRLDELLEQQREGQLTSEDHAELAHLSRAQEQALLLKAEAMAEAVHRGLCEAA